LLLIPGSERFMQDMFTMLASSLGHAWSLGFGPGV
jgi:hypothetical protein